MRSVFLVVIIFNCDVWCVPLQWTVQCQFTQFLIKVHLFIKFSLPVSEALRALDLEEEFEEISQEELKVILMPLPQEYGYIPVHTENGLVSMGTPDAWCTCR